LKGKGSFQLVDQKPCLVIKWDEFVPGQQVQGFTKVLLHNGGRDPSLMREYLSASMLQDARLPAARVSHARASLNGRDLGFYALIEAMNKPFLRRVFGSDTGNLYEGDLKDIDSPLEQDNGKVKDQADRERFLAIARIPDPVERWKRLPEVLDVDRFVTFLALGRLMGHNDSYAGRRNNYRIYHDPKTDKMVFLHHSLKSTFLREDTAPLAPPENSIVTKAVLQTWPGRKLYRERLGQLFTNVYRVDVLTNRVQDELARMLPEAASADEAAKLKIEAKKLCDIVAANARHFAKELSRPEPETPRFGTNGVFTVTGWQPASTNGVVAERTRLDGREVLHLRIPASESVTEAAWKTRLVLEPGKYRLSGRCQTAGVKLDENNPGLGAGVYLTARPGNGGRYFGTDWRELSKLIEVQDGPREVWLQCSLRTSQGEAWFDAGSLQLIKEKEQPPKQVPTKREPAEEDL
jgi:hypothetical protein